MEEIKPEAVTAITEEQKPKRGVVFYMLVVAAGLAAFGIIAAIAGYGYISAQARKPIVFSEARTFVIEKGESVQTIAEDLEKKGLVSRGFYFWFYVWQNDLSRSLQAGTYAVEGPVSAKTIADMIARGEVVRDTISVTIPEGYGIWTIEKKLRETGLLAKEKRHLVDLSIGEFAAQHDFLADASVDANLDGYLFPDTYEFKKDATLDEIVGRMLDNFGRKLDASLREEIRRQGKSISDIVIMASMIQKEVITPEDMKLVSGLLWHRIAIGMALQVDATVSYTLDKNDLTRADLATDTPYNTYLYKGLPKGPIGNPGKEALLAAIYPTENDYLFYISKPNKETVFSRTLSEHNAAVQKYLR